MGSRERKAKMQMTRRIARIVLCLAVIVTVSALGIGPLGTVPVYAHPKSLYVAANHHTQQFDAWNINPDGTLTYQATYWLNHATDPAGIGIDETTGTDPATGQPRDPLMFVSTEGTGGIEVINPVTLQFHGVAPGPVNMGGVDVDDINNILFAIQRGTSAWGGSGTNQLYVYTYNDDGSGIAQQAQITVPGLGRGMGLAFDDFRNVLWIGDTQHSMVRAYRPDNPTWTAISEDTSLSFNVSHSPVDVAVDRVQNIVYTGGAWFGSTLLTKYDVSAGAESTVDTVYGVMGVAVDEATGYVYLTRGFSGDDMQVWDCSTSPFTLLQDTPPIGNPAGIAIGNVSYNPLNLAKNDVIVGEVYIGSTFTYEITYENPHPYDVHNVTIVDTLPGELDFVSASDGGVYDPALHTVTWNIGTLPAGTPPPTIQLVVEVNQSAVPGSTIYNYATITGDEVPPTTVIDDEGSEDPQDEPGTPIGESLPVAVDIKPGSCPNPLNVRSRGVLPVAVLGTEDFDVTLIDPASVSLAGVAPLRWAMEDVATPYEPFIGKELDPFSCTTEGQDGYMDLTLKYDTQEVVAALGDVNDGDVLALQLTGNLMDEFGGTPILGEDVVVILDK